LRILCEVAEAEECIDGSCINNGYPNALIDDMESRSTSLSSFMYTDDWLAMSGNGTMTSLPFGRATGKWNSTIILAVAMGAIVAVSVGVALSTSASGRATELLRPARFASKAADNELLKYR
jgi:hypothetical protein